MLFDEMPSEFAAGDVETAVSLAVDVEEHELGRLALTGESARRSR